MIPMVIWESCVEKGRASISLSPRMTASEGHLDHLFTGAVHEQEIHFWSVYAKKYMS